ncbi:MAG: recombinase RecT [Flavobacteriales bacterium]|jgi:recombination protein RecT|nr:recombinase RecT [Flavobacteriales bacterium]
MSNTNTNKLALKEAFSNETLKKKFQEVLGQKSAGFIASVLTLTSNNKLLATADKNSIISSAMVAATLDLPINPNLGFAYIVPYGKQAQFQLGYKGFIQLAQRSGKFKTINVTAVKEGELQMVDYLTGEYSFKWEQNFSERNKAKTIGYVAYFELINGFSKSLFMSLEDVENHALKYSQSFKKGDGVWKDNFEAMASKTVLKLLLSKYAPMSIEMEKAMVTDQAVVNDLDGNVDYPDNTEEVEATIIENVEDVIANAKSKEDLDAIWSSLSEEEQAENSEIFNAKLKEIK